MAKANKKPPNQPSKRGPGQPTVMTEEIQDEICQRIAQGESLVRILKSNPERFPDYTTVCRALRASEGKPGGFCQRYARAREDQADYLFDEMKDIADDNHFDTYVDDEGNERVNHDHINRARLRVDTRKFMAMKLRPKRYGEKIQNEHTGKDGEPLALGVIYYPTKKEPGAA